ncbi:MAG: VWA domain-containing protein [archaeon]|nr:VWA domain-containing protein [archaeon]
MKIKGQEIASIVCKKNAVVEIFDEATYLSNIWDRFDAKEENKIFVSTKILNCDPLQALRNFRVHVAHDSSHFYLSEIKKWQRWYKFDKLRFFIANLIEDHRCNNFLINRYPGLKRDFASYLAYSFLHHKNVQEVPKELRFLLALVQYVTFGRIKGDYSVLSKFQLEKIEKVKSLLDCAMWSYLFDEELLPCAEQIYKLISDEFLLSSPFESHTRETISDDVVVEKPESRFEIKGKESTEYPGEEMGTLGKASGEELKLSEKTLKNYEEQVIGEFADEFNVNLDPSEVEKKLVRDLFGVDIDEQYINLKERRDQKIKQYFSKKPLEVHTPNEDWGFFYKCRSEVLSQIQKLSSDFLFIKQAQDWEENYRKGPCLSSDFVQRMLNKDKHLFKRYIEKEADTKWLILTDVSSSVFASEVTELTILLSEVAHVALGNDNFCICAFSNNFYIVKDFNEGYDRIVKGRIGGMYSGGTTNICDSIEFCMNRLGKFPSETKVLMVITDGEPNTCKTGNPLEHTKAAVRKTFSRDIFTIGVGTQRNISVSNYFPVHFNVRSLSDFPKFFQRIYSRVIFELDKPVVAVDM